MSPVLWSDVAFAFKTSTTEYPTSQATLKKAQICGEEEDGFGPAPAGKMDAMPEDASDEPKNEQSAETTVNWAELRAQAAKLGISLSQLQQQQRQQKLKLAQKNQRVAARPANTSDADGTKDSET